MCMYVSVLVHIRVNASAFSWVLPCIPGTVELFMAIVSHGVPLIVLAQSPYASRAFPFHGVLDTYPHLQVPLAD